MTRPATIVSVTPLRVDRDTRTFKEALSFARLGYRSVVVEGGRSTFESPPEEFELISPDAPAAPVVQSDPPSPGTLRRAASRPFRAPAELVAERLAARALAERIPAGDLYWLHGYSQGRAVARAAQRAGSPLVYDAHDFYPEIIEGGPGVAVEREVVRRFWLREERASARSAAVTLTVSEGVADLFEGLGRRRPLVVRNCAELRVPAAPGNVRTAAGIPSDAFVVVMPGNHKPGTRAVDEAIAAMRSVPDRAHLVFVGGNYDSVDVPAELAARVHIVPAVAALEVPNFIASADAAVVLYVPTLVDIEHALPNGLFTAIAAGLPLLYPPLSEIGRLAREHDLGLEIEPRVPDSVAEGIRRLMDDAGAAARFRANAERARDVLNWEREEQRLAAIIDDVLGRSA